MLTRTSWLARAGDGRRHKRGIKIDPFRLQVCSFFAPAFRARRALRALLERERSGLGAGEGNVDFSVRRSGRPLRRAAVALAAAAASLALRAVALAAVALAAAQVAAAPLAAAPVAAVALPAVALAAAQVAAAPLAAAPVAAVALAAVAQALTAGARPAPRSGQQPPPPSWTRARGRAARI